MLSGADRHNMADMEDLFDAEDYIALYNAAVGTKVKKKSDLKGSDPIIVQIARHAGEKRYEHNKPADNLLRNRDKLLKGLSEASLTNFQRLL
jgi:hypothetical protein